MIDNFEISVKKMTGKNVYKFHLSSVIILLNV